VNEANRDSAALVSLLCCSAYTIVRAGGNINSKKVDKSLAEILVLIWVNTALANVLKETRSEILRSLRVCRQLTVEEISCRVGLSKVSVRRHLDLLSRDGLVEFEIQRHPRGRPAHVYHLTDKAELLFPKEYKAFALNILGQVSSMYGAAGLCCLICRQAEELIGTLRPDLEQLDFSGKVKKLSKLLQERGFESSIRRLADGSYVIRQGNCPMVAVAERYPQVCDEELRVYRELLRTDVVRQSRIASGDLSCDYKISNPGTAGMSEPKSA
jgi:predicted ArsR family transcriptional regulator